MSTLTTPILGFPYPDGAERVMDGDNAIKALAEAVDSTLARAVNPPGVVVQGPLRTMVGTPEKLPLAGPVVAGVSTFLDDAGDQLVVPANQSGLYLMWAYGTATLPTAGGILRLAIRTGGTAVQVGTSVFTNAGFSSFWNMMGVLPLTDGMTTQVFAETSAGNLATVTVSRFGLVRIGTQYQLFAPILRALSAGDAEGKPGELGL